MPRRHARREIRRDSGPLQQKLSTISCRQALCPDCLWAQPAILLEDRPGQQFQTGARDRKLDVEHLLAIGRKVKRNCAIKALGKHRIISLKLCSAGGKEAQNSELEKTQRLNCLEVDRPPCVRR